MAASRGEFHQSSFPRQPLTRSSLYPGQGDEITRRLRQRRRTRQPLAEAEKVVHSIHPSAKPLWLSLLLRLQQASALFTILLAAGVLVTYGWTVFIQDHWGKKYDKLEVLKKQERQLISANEVLKNQMAEQAEKSTAGLLLPDPSNAIFLAPAPQRPQVKPKPTVLPVEPTPTKPLGY